MAKRKPAKKASRKQRKPRVKTTATIEVDDVYAWADTMNVGGKGVGINKPVDAQIVNGIIQKIADKNGRECTPQELLEAARSKRSPINKCFEWDNFEGAERYRLQQASYLLRKVKVILVTEEGEERKVSAWSSVRSKRQPNKRAYVRTIEAMETDTEWHEEILMNALRQLVSWRKKWAHLNEISQAIRMVDKGINQIEQTIGDG